MLAAHLVEQGGEVGPDVLVLQLQHPNRGGGGGPELGPAGGPRAHFLAGSDDELRQLLGLTRQGAGGTRGEMVRLKQRQDRQGSVGFS